MTVYLTVSISMCTPVPDGSQLSPSCLRDAGTPRPSSTALETDVLLSSAGGGDSRAPLASMLPICCMSCTHSGAAAAPVCSLGAPLPLSAPALLPEGLLFHPTLLTHPFTVPPPPSEAPSVKVSSVHPPSLRAQELCVKVEAPRP